MDPQDIADLIASLQGKSDHDLLIALNVQMMQVLERLKKGDECMDEHDRRIGKLENFQSTLIGIAVTLSAAITILGNWAWMKLTGGS